MERTPLKQFLEIPYEELEEKNLEAKQRVFSGESEEQLRSYYLGYLEDEKRIKAVTVCFSDIEGRFHMLDYDKKFLLRSYENLTFDGSSIRGFSRVKESDLRLKVDWGSFRWLPSDVFGPGKVIVFCTIQGQDGSDYKSDFRATLKNYTEELREKYNYRVNISVECEGFLFEGINAEQNYTNDQSFRFVSNGGYYHSLPNEPLRQFIDRFAEAQRAMGFQNEKDHPEVAPSQFELNYTYCPAPVAADQLQLYKLLARQIARNLGYTACFLPKPISGINGTGMHTNLSISRNDENLFYCKDGKDALSEMAWDFIKRSLGKAVETCLIFNSSVNAYRRLDPRFEAPNRIMASAVDRTSMIRIPWANERSARVELRAVAPDTNPYLSFYTMLRSGLEGPVPQDSNGSGEYLPSNIYDAIDAFKESEFTTELFGADVKEKYIQTKLQAADRCPKELGTLVKPGEIIFHHEVSNQYLWSRF